MYKQVQKFAPYNKYYVVGLYPVEFSLQYISCLIYLHALNRGRPNKASIIRNDGAHDVGVDLVGFHKGLVESH